MAVVADDFADKGGPKPIFATQSDNIEKFGQITKETHDIIYQLFGIAVGQENQNKAEKTLPTAPKIESIYTKAQEISCSRCYSEQKLIEFIKDFKKEVETWSGEVKKIYKITLDTDITPNEVPNVEKIGEWLSDKKEDNYFADVKYGSESVTTEEYKALPRKPIKYNDSLFAFGTTISSYHRSKQHDEIEYKLESVTKAEKFVNGFSYTHTAQDRILKIIFDPIIEIAPPICVYTVSIYSNKTLSIHFSCETLKRKNWVSYSSPTCEKWRTFKINVNGKKPANSAATHIKNEITQWIEVELKKRTE